MELTVMERLILLGALPAEGNLTTLRIVRQLREALSFSEEEHAALRFVNLNEQGKPAQPGEPVARMVWDQKGIVAKEIELGAKAQALIVETLEGLDKDGKLTADHLSLCDKFKIGE
jgi:hypothetical protein